MIFASDLDQTLIYSINFLNKHYNDHQQLRDDSLSLIEMYNGEPLSYIHNEVIEKVRQIDATGLFVPVTTRTEAQYKRIEFSKFEIHPQYAVTTNGAKVLKNGEVDKEWEGYILSRLKDNAVDSDKITKLIKAIIPSTAIKKIRTAEEIFTYCVLHRSLFDTDLLLVLERELGSAWKLSLQGTKLYFMPSVVSKGDALKYVQQQLGEDEVVAAGDSLLDIPLLEKADMGIIPTHGEIFNQSLQHKHAFKVAKGKGVEASIGILNLI